MGKEVSDNNEDEGEAEGVRAIKAVATASVVVNGAHYSKNRIFSPILIFAPKATI